MSGCALGQRGVANFVTALKEIDGVTRVGVESSALAEESEGGGSSSSGSSGAKGGEVKCPADGLVATFQLVVAFDAAPVPSESSGSTETAAAPAAAASESSTTASSGSSSEGEG